MPKRVKAERRLDRLERRKARLERKDKKKRVRKVEKKIKKVGGRIEKQKQVRAKNVANFKKFKKGLDKAVKGILKGFKSAAEWVDNNKSAIKDVSNTLGEIAVAVNPEAEEKIRKAQDKLEKGIDAIDKVKKGIDTAEDLKVLYDMIDDKENVMDIIMKAAEIMENSGDLIEGDKGKKLKETAELLRKVSVFSEDVFEDTKELIEALKEKDIGKVIKSGEKLGKKGKEGVDIGKDIKSHFYFK